MPAQKGKGIADDAGDYEDVLSSPPPLKKKIQESEKTEAEQPSEQKAEAKPKQRQKDGIAEDADGFADLVDESTGKARTLDSDWLYQLNGQVFGPVKPKDLLELLYDGKINRDTQIALDGGDFTSLHRIGVFRVHLPKVEKRKIEVEAAYDAEETAAKATLRKRIAWVAIAIVVAAPLTAGIVWYIRDMKADAARAEARVKEEALLKEVDALMATVTIEPPLIDIPDEGSSGTPGRRRSRGVAKFSGGNKVIGAGGTGELSRAEVMAGIATVFTGFKRCIVEQIQRDADSVPEQIILTFSINNEGMIQDTSLSDRTLRGSPMRGCLAGQLGKVRYRAFKGEVQNVEYPITVGRQ